MNFGENVDAAQGGSDASRPMILMVDDEPILCEILREEMEGLGFATIEASTVPDALRIIETQRVDVVLCDIRMHGAGGIEFLVAVQQKKEGRPAVFLCSGFPEISLAEAKQLGAQGLFCKPYDFQLIARSIREVISANLTNGTAL